MCGWRTSLRRSACPRRCAIQICVYFTLLYGGSPSSAVQLAVSTQCRLQKLSFYMRHCTTGILYIVIKRQFFYIYISYRFRNKARYWSKTWIFHTPLHLTCHFAPIAKNILHRFMHKWSWRSWMTFHIRLHLQIRATSSSSSSGGMPFYLELSPRLSAIYIGLAHIATQNEGRILSVSVASHVSTHLLIRLSADLYYHHHSHHPSLHHSFTLGSKPTFSTNPFHLRFILPTGLPSWQRDWTGPIMLIVLFLVSHFNFLFVPCSGLSWLSVRFLLHVKYTLSYRIVSYRCCTGGHPVRLREAKSA